MSRLVRALSACAFAVACAVASRAPIPTEAIAWRDCGDGAECGEIGAPLDYDAPDGPAIRLALIRFRATAPAQRIGVLFVNPGGPGVSSVAYLRSAMGRYQGTPLRSHFDLVAVDPRGAGGSARLDCHSNLRAFYTQDPNANGDEAWQALVAGSRAVADECRARQPDVLPFMGTVEDARDLDWIRATLGEVKLSYVGYSYGTALGATYATLFPERVRAMVLDGAIDPSFDLLRFTREQATAAEEGLEAYAVEAQRKGWYGIDNLDAAYLRADDKGEVLYGVAEGISTPPDGWRDLAEALGAHEEGESRAFKPLADRYFGRRRDGSSDIAIETQLAVLCADMKRPADTDAFRAALPDAEKASRHFGRANLLAHLPCAFWPAPAHALGPPGSAAALPPILVLSNDHDPLTPEIWGDRLAARFPSAQRFEVRSRTHTAYAKGNACVDDLVDAYLMAPVAPARADCP